MKVDLVLRNADESDLPFIYKTWLVNIRASNNLETIIEAKVYFDNHKLLIDRILSKSECVLATSPEDTKQIFGFIVFHRMKKLDVLHFVHVKAPYRKLGIAGHLKDFAFNCELDDPPLVSTHFTRMAPILTESWNLIFNPYILFDFYGE